jgi:hypothetical protein
MPFGLLLLISFAVFNLGYIVDQTLRWSDHLQGFANGIFHIMFSGIAWCMFLLPCILVIFLRTREVLLKAKFPVTQNSNGSVLPVSLLYLRA